jgi:DNA-directed RNA polymerase specialized sigma24 family protein
MKFRSLSREWRIVRAPRPKPWDRRGLRASQLHPRGIKTPVLQLSDVEIEKLYARLHAAADKFWPHLNRDERDDRVSNTVFEAVRRLKENEKHTISWWVKFMWGTSITASLRNREDPYDEQAFDLWAGSTPATQDCYVEGRQTMRLCDFLPEPNRTVMYLRIDGANPIEIADETKLPVDRVISILSDSRKYLSDGGAYLDASESTRFRSQCTMRTIESRKRLMIAE